MTAARWWDELHGAQCPAPTLFCCFEMKRPAGGSFWVLGGEARGCLLSWLGLLMCLWSILRLWPCGAKQPLTRGRDQLQNKSPAGKHQVPLSSERGWQHPCLLPVPIAGFWHFHIRN